MYDTINIPLGKHQLWVTQRQWFKIQYRVQPPCAWMKASTFRVIPPVSCRMYCCGSCRYSRRKFCTRGPTACTRQPSVSEECFIGFKFGFMTDHGRKFMASLWRLAVTALQRCVVIHRYKLVGVWRNGELQLVARYLWCSDHQLGFLR